MTTTKNPYLEPENYYQGYQDSIDNLNNKPEALEMDKLCYLVFSTDEGKRLIEEFKSRFIMPGFVHPGSDNAATSAMYYEGFKEAFRMILSCIKSHDQRIQAQSTKL